MTENKGGETKLAVIWSSGDREVAFSNVFMYTKNSKLRGWWDRVLLVAWGPSSKLITQDKELQDELQLLKDAGVELQACKACSDRYGVSEKLEELGFEVTYMGVPLTEMLQGDWTCLTY